MAISAYDKQQARIVKKRQWENRIKRLEGRKSTARRDERIKKQKLKLAGVNKMILGSKEIDSDTVVSTSQQENIATMVSPSARREERRKSNEEEYTPLTKDFKPGNKTKEVNPHQYILPG
tara:strand:+ start:199 stop:558 length:360 start_codon:yes stop_codon:yes gene_type:complete